jgi:diguanylate cyclase (GGDEF)-like protein
MESQTVNYALILALSVIITYLFVKNKLSKDKIKYYSEYDELTNSLNRRAGFFRLRELRSALQKNPRNLSICYIDIDDLKQVNDIFGHEAGDELIKTVVDSIQKNIRQSDFMIRLGGDEFLVVLMDTNEKDAEEIWQRIQSEFDSVNGKENRRYKVSASHGIEECKVSDSCNIDSNIQKADQKMYKEKRLNKKRLKVIKNET